MRNSRTGADPRCGETIPSRRTAGSTASRKLAQNLRPRSIFAPADNKAGGRKWTCTCRRAARSPERGSENRPRATPPDPRRPRRARQAVRMRGMQLPQPPPRLLRGLPRLFLCDGCADHAREVLPELQQPLVERFGAAPTLEDALALGIVPSRNASARLGERITSVRPEATQVERSRVHEREAIALSTGHLSREYRARRWLMGGRRVRPPSSY